MFESSTIVGTCINCIAPGSLSATLALILIGGGIALAFEPRKVTQAVSRSNGDKR